MGLDHQIYSIRGHENPQCCRAVAEYGKLEDEHRGNAPLFRFFAHIREKHTGEDCSKRDALVVELTLSNIFDFERYIDGRDYGQNRGGWADKDVDLRFFAKCKEILNRGERAFYCGSY